MPFWLSNVALQRVLRLLSYNHPFTYVLLFLLLAVLRAPSFHPQHLTTDEACYLVAAERIADGGVQYEDTWDNKPPVITWFYLLFVWAFGKGALLGVRIFTVAYLYITAILLNQIINNQKILQSFSLLPAYVFIILTSVPWYAQELNCEMLMLAPAIGAFYQLFLLEEREPSNHARMFMAGLLMGLSFMIKYQAIFLVMGLGLAYLVILPPRISEFFSLVAGFLLTLGALVMAVHFTGALPAFWDVGVLYNLDYLVVGSNPGEEISPLANLLQYAKLWGAFLLMGVVSIVQFRLNYYSHTIRQRKMESITLIWLVAALLTVAIGLGRLYLHYFILMVPPLTVYVAKFQALTMRRWIRALPNIASVAWPAFTYAAFLLAAFPATFGFADRFLNIRPVDTQATFMDPYHESQPLGWIQTHRILLNEPDPLERHIDRARVHNGILVLDLLPEHYVRLGLPCATRYTNFSVAWYKMTCLDHNTGRDLFSSPETEAEVYRAFSEDMPDYIVDPHGVFPQMQGRIPLLLAGYRQVPLPYYKAEVHTYALWERVQ